MCARVALSQRRHRRYILCVCCVCVCARPTEPIGTCRVNSALTAGPHAPGDERRPRPAAPRIRDPPAPQYGNHHVHCRSERPSSVQTETALSPHPRYHAFVPGSGVCTHRDGTHPVQSCPTDVDCYESAGLEGPTVTRFAVSPGTPRTPKYFRVG
jgi:hypothetical protein